MHKTRSVSSMSSRCGIGTTTPGHMISCIAMTPSRCSSHFSFLFDGLAVGYTASRTFGRLHLCCTSPGLLYTGSGQSCSVTMPEAKAPTLTLVHRETTTSRHKHPLQARHWHPWGHSPVCKTKMASDALLPKPSHATNASHVWNASRVTASGAHLTKSRVMRTDATVYAGAVF